MNKLNFKKENQPKARSDEMPTPKKPEKNLKYSRRN